MMRAKLILGAALAALLFAAGWYVRGLQEDRTQLQIARVVAAVNDIKAQHIAAIKVENKTIHAKTVERIRVAAIYTECKQDEVMLGLTNYSLTGKR